MFMQVHRESEAHDVCLAELQSSLFARLHVAVCSWYWLPRFIFDCFVQDVCAQHLITCRKAIQRPMHWPFCSPSCVESKTRLESNVPKQYMRAQVAYEEGA